MIQHAFTSAYTNRVSQQNQGISNITKGAKDTALLAAGSLGFAGALGDGAVAKAAEYGLAGRVGGIGGAIMLSTMQEKTQQAKIQEEKKQVFTSEEVGETIKSQLGTNPINSPALKQLNTVFDTLMKAKEEGMLTKKGKLDTSMGEIDPNSELGKKIMGGLK